MTQESWSTAVPVTRTVHCESCQGLVELQCQGLGGIVMYETYNEYLCPHCGKQNHARTPGAIVTAHAGLVQVHP